MSFTPGRASPTTRRGLRGSRRQGPALVVRSGGGRAGESFFPSGERTLIGRSPDCDVFLDDVTVSRRMRSSLRDGDTFTISDLGSLNGTFVNKQRIETRRARGRRRAADRQVPADLPAPMTHGDRAPTARPRRLHTIGAVCARLQREFPDISISKIRYLEDQGLLDAEAHARRLPAVQRGGRRAAGDDPAAAARRVPAAAGDQAGARAAPARRAQAAPPRRARRAGGGARPRRALRARRHRRGARARARGVRAARRRASRAASGSTAKATPTSRPLRAPRRSSASTRAICAPSATPPAASGRCSSSSSPRRCAHGTRAAQGGPRGPAGARRGSQELSQLLFWRELRALAGGRVPRDLGGDARPARPRPRRPGLPEAGHRLQGHDAARRRRRRTSARRSTGSRQLAGRSSPTSSWAPRRAASSSAARSPTGSAAASCRRASRASCRGDGRARPTSSSTARTRSVHADAIGRGRARDRPRRRARDGRHREGEDRARRAARRRGGRPALRGRARRS